MPFEPRQLWSRLENRSNRVLPKLQAAVAWRVSVEEDLLLYLRRRGLLFSLISFLLLLKLQYRLEVPIVGCF